MAQKHRISTNIGKDQVIKVELKQDFDLLEILSLKFTQKEIYTSLCADYGVVVGRISVNDGFGVSNARVSIFIPLDEVDENDPVISELYPYKSVTDRNDDGYKYNLLPSRQQHSGHSPTGTFPDQTDILNREEYLEIYEKYYKYTVKTNESGDFMIWGVPLGTQTLHVDIDLSDMGCQSMVPFDFIYDGISEEKFENKYTFMSSENLDTLPQIISFDKTIDVYPFWGNEDLCEIGITRTDFDLGVRGVRLEPYAIMMGGTFSDSGKDALRVNCNVDNQMGEKCRLTTYKGDIESIRFTGEYEKDANGIPQINRPLLERFAIDSTIDENGLFFFKVPMNTDYYVTNEFGEAVLSKEKKGIPTEGTYRFRFSLNEDTGERNRFTGKFLVPNIREVHSGDTLNRGQESTINKKSYAFSTNLDDYPQEMIPYITGTDSQSISEGKRGVPQDYFYKFRYNRVYTVTQYLNKYDKKSALESTFSFFTKDRRESFIGIKEIWPAEKDDCAQTNNYFPINEAVRNHRFNFFIIGFIILLEQVLNTIILFIKEFVLGLLFDLADTIQGLPTKGIKVAGNNLMVFTKRLQFRWISRFSLVTYPDCEKCSEDNQNEPTVFAVQGIDIDDVRSGAIGTVVFSNQSMVENYQTSLPSGCNEYEVTETTNGTGTTITYNSCGNGIATYSLSAGEVVTIYATATPTATSGSVSVVNNGSAAGQSNLDSDLYFTTAQKNIITGSTFNAGHTIDDHRFVLEIEIVPSFIGQTDPQGLGLTGSNTHYYYFQIGRGAPFPIDNGDYSINGLYGEIAEVIALIFNKNIDETEGNSCHTTQGQVNIKRLIYIDTPEPVLSTNTLEDGCSKYDTIYDPDGSMNLVAITLPTGNGIPLSGGTTTYGNLTGSPYSIGMITSDDLSSIGFDGTLYSGIRDFLISKNSLKENTSGGVSPLTNPWLNAGSNPSKINLYPWPIFNQLDSSYDISFGDDEDPCGPRPQTNYAAVVSLDTRDGTSWWWSNRSYRCVVGAPYQARANSRRIREENGQYMDPDNNGTISGYSEFRDGVYTIVPLAGKNVKLLNDYIRRKRLGMIMCGGITSYVFSDSWLSGALYFFQFMKRGAADAKRYCTDNLVHVKDENGTHFYYRSTPWSETYNSSSTDYDKGFYGQNRKPDEVNPRKEINYPTTIIDLGPRTSWINEVCVDPELDVNCSVVRSIGSTSFKPIDDLMEYVLQAKEIKEKGRLDAPDLFDSRGKGRMDGDIVQLINFNTQTGIYPFEIEEGDSPYLDYIDSFDGQGPVGINFVYSEDNPDTETVEYNGYKIRVCINKPGYLGDNSQYVPYYRWNTWGDGFGDKSRFNGSIINSNGESQDWVDTTIYTQRIQEMKANLNLDQNTNSTDDNYYEPYALPPIRDCLEINGVVSQTNDNYKEYNGNHHMELTGPFHYVFGLRKGNTAWDKFIENFGPK